MTVILTNNSTFGVDGYVTTTETTVIDLIIREIVSGHHIVALETAIKAGWTYRTGSYVVSAA